MEIDARITVLQHATRQFVTNIQRNAYMGVPTDGLTQHVSNFAQISATVHRVISFLVSALVKMASMAILAKMLVLRTVQRRDVLLMAQHAMDVVQDPSVTYVKVHVRIFAKIILVTSLTVHVSIVRKAILGSPAKEVIVHSLLDQ